MNSTRISDVMNERLSAVSFLHDYIEFHFDGKIVRVFTGPVVTRNGEAFGPNQLGWRDALCSLIESTAERVEFAGDYGANLRLTFSDDVVVDISLVSSDASVPEALHYVGGENQAIEVW